MSTNAIDHGESEARWLRALPRGYRPVVGNRRFALLLPGLLVSRFGDAMTGVALVWLALRISGAHTQGIVVGAAVSAYVLPGAFSGLMFGRLFSRVPGSRLLQYDSWLRAGVLLVIFLLAAAGALSVGGYIALLATSSFFHAWGSGGRQALVVDLIAPEHRRAANSLMYSFAQLSIVLGPALAGVISALMGPGLVFLLDSATFVVLACSLALWAPASRARAEGDDAKGAFPGLRIFAHKPQLGMLLALTAVVCVVTGPVEVALPLYVTHTLRASATVLGIFWTVFGIGGVVGALIAGAIRRLPLWPTVLAIALAYAASLLPLAFVSSLVPALLGFAVGGLVYAPYPAIAATLLQRESTASEITLVGAAWSGTLLIAEPIGFAVGGPVTQWLGAQQTIAACAASTVAIALLCAPAVAIHSLRRRK